VREDGRVIRDMYLMQVKTPEESKGEWDLAKIIATVPGKEAFRPLDEGGCPLVGKK
jgi:branched-chain amino acid transport system substrate-binding protein